MGPYCALADFPWDLTLNAQTAGPPVIFAPGKPQTIASPSLAHISSAYPSSHPQFKPGPFSIGDVCVTTMLPGLFERMRVIRPSSFRCRSQ